MIRQLRALLVSLSFLSLCSLGFAQNAQIQGRVSDSSGALIPKATIRIVDQQTGTERKTVTNGSGQYTVAGLDPSVYKIFVQASGFSTAVSTPITLNVAQNAVLDFKMQVGDVGQTVTVDGSGLQINTVDASVSTVIDRNFVQNIPLNGRSFQDLLTLSPGVAQVPSPTSASSVGYSGSLVVNGQRTEENYFTIDGVSANTGTPAGQVGTGAGVSGGVPALTALGTTQSLVSIDALQEFRANTSTYSAEYGRTPGGNFSFTTRSGTNRLHGEIYDYFRNDALDANNWFNDYYSDPKTKERQNDFGGTLSGPISIPHLYQGKDRSFFFFSYEGLRLDSPQPATPQLVPDQLLRQGAPSSLQPLLNAFPVANGGEDGLNNGFGYYIESVSNPATFNNTGIRVDQKIGEHLLIFGRYADSPSNSTSYSRAVRQVVSQGNQTVTLGSTYVLSLHQTNDFRFNYTSTTGATASTSTSLGNATPLSVTTLPGPNGNSFPENGSELYAVFTFASFTNFTLSSLPSSQHQLNITDTHDWTFGRHALKAGVDWRKLTSTLVPVSIEEEVAFTSESQVLTGSPALGIVSNYNASSFKPVYQNFSTFIQDEWRLSSRLGLSFGLRWDVNPAPTSASGPRPYTVTQVSDLSTTTLAPQGTSLWKTDWAGFAPRLGVAYQAHPGSERNTVIRTGFGLFYDLGNTNGSAGYNGIGFQNSQTYFSPSFPLTSAQLTIPPGSVTTPYSEVVFGFDPNLKLPYSLQYSASIEQALDKSESVTLGYVGSGGRRLTSVFETYPQAIGNTNFAAGSTLDVIQGRASSGYNALQLKYERRMSHGLQILTSYTWSHSIDNASNNFTTLGLLRADSDFDIRHNAQAAVTYQPTTWRSSSKLSPFMNGWALDGRLQARTALPINVIGDQQQNPQTGELINYQPSLVPGNPIYLYGSQYPGHKIINYQAFAAPVGIEGNAPRNFTRAFDAVQLDTAIRRDFSLHDALHLEFRAEAFNILNHPQFGAVYNYLSSGPVQFGHAYSTLNTFMGIGGLNSLYQTGGPRSLQLALKIRF